MSTPFMTVEWKGKKFDLYHETKMHPIREVNEKFITVKYGEDLVFAAYSKDLPPEKIYDNLKVALLSQ